jgi:hypothetical protein
MSQMSMQKYIRLMLSFIDYKSLEGTKIALDLFTTPVT